MVASIGKIASPSQGVGHFEKDGYYANEDAAHREASFWVGEGAKTTRDTHNMATREWRNLNHAWFRVFCDRLNSGMLVRSLGRRCSCGNR